jgi:hypothetical protein
VAASEGCEGPPHCLVGRCSPAALGFDGEAFGAELSGDFGAPLGEAVSHRRGGAHLAKLRADILGRSEEPSLDRRVLAVARWQEGDGGLQGTGDPAAGAEFPEGDQEFRQWFGGLASRGLSNIRTESHAKAGRGAPDGGRENGQLSDALAGEPSPKALGGNGSHPGQWPRSGRVIRYIALHGDPGPGNARGETG